MFPLSTHTAAPPIRSHRIARTITNRTGTYGLLSFRSLCGRSLRESRKCYRHAARETATSPEAHRPAPPCLGPTLRPTRFGGGDRSAPPCKVLDQLRLYFFDRLPDGIVTPRWP